MIKREVPLVVEEINIKYVGLIKRFLDLMRTRNAPSRRKRVGTRG